MLYVTLPPQWLKDQGVTTSHQLDCSFEEVVKYNNAGHNIYYYPNYPSSPGTHFVKASEVDTFEWVFLDMDLKQNVYMDKEEFLGVLAGFPLRPTKVVDTGNGLHVYFRVSDLDAMSFLRLSRRLMRHFNTDPAVTQLKQLMRVPNTVNTKDPLNPKYCQVLSETDNVFTCEELDKALPMITAEDEAFCKGHYDKVHNIQELASKVDEKLPPKFGKLLRECPEAKAIWLGSTLGDRSTADYRLGHLMFAAEFTRQEALSVLVNCPKALTRAPQHRIGYAERIVDKIWTFEATADKKSLNLSSSVMDILSRSGEQLQGTRLPCYKYIDDTVAGFRLGQVMGLVAGSGVGKTSLALNIFMGFVASNPDYDHFFVPLEQSDREIAVRWKTMCGNNTALHSKVQVLSNYDDNGVYRDLSLSDIKAQVLKHKLDTGRAIGCVVIDHIGVLCNNNRLGQDEGVKQICKDMKAFAMETNTFLIMQSQTSREKAGIGDLELNKDAAFGTSVFENFTDFMVTLWQPLKRMYTEGAPTVMSYKFCKVRDKMQGHDVLQEDVCYSVFFDPVTQRVRELNENEEKGLSYWVAQATTKRKQDRKTDIVDYTSVKWTKEGKDAEKTRPEAA